MLLALLLTWSEGRRSRHYYRPSHRRHSHSRSRSHGHSHSHSHSHKSHRYYDDYDDYEDDEYAPAPRRRTSVTDLAAALGLNGIGYVANSGGALHVVG